MLCQMDEPMRTSLAAQMRANPASQEAVGWKAEFAEMNEVESTYREIQLTVSTVTGDVTKLELLKGRNDLSHKFDIEVTA
jgi:hypothetical protein